MGLINKLASFVTGSYLQQVEQTKKMPLELQHKWFNYILKSAAPTVYGKKYGFDKINTYQQFQKQVPIVSYEDFFPFIERARKGESDVIWKGKIDWFAKSSGTTNAKSKFIPITQESLDGCHYAGGKMLFANYLKLYPDTQIFKRRNLRIGGSAEVYQEYETKYGDLSAIMIENLPFWTEFMNTPNRDISLMSEWEEKLEAITNAVINENVTSLTGVPSWMLVVLNRVLEKTGKSDLHEVWPLLEVFFHGGISFKPYESNYHSLTKKSLHYHEIYNASEGFFAFQDQPSSKDLLLLLDSGIFYEFIPLDKLEDAQNAVIPLEGVKEGVNYAMVITTNGGLFRYLIGDTVRFVSLQPYRVIVSGRTKHYINAFGEELIIENAEEALHIASQKTHAKVAEYTAAPIFMKGKESGAHEWIIEFDQMPNDLSLFTQIMDKELQLLNSDYEAKRYNNMTLNPPVVHMGRKGLFYDWMKERGKLGGQNKVPRLSNNREYIDPLLEMNNQ